MVLTPTPFDGHGTTTPQSAPDTILDAVDSALPFMSPPTERWSVESVLATIPNAAPTTKAPASTIPFLHLLERLKTTKREGWRRLGITQGESISDHMYRMSIMTMVCPSPLTKRLDIPKCTKMALVHDMAESLVGDITPVDPVPKAEKSRRERETMLYIEQMLEGSGSMGAGTSLREVWDEYEEGTSDEAIFVHDVDKMELILQMVEYERRGEGALDLKEFSWVATRIQLPEMKAWCAEVLTERDVMWKAFEDNKPKGNVTSKTPALP